jgi:hypothetical protein
MWKETAKNWHSLREGNKPFFKEVASNLGHHPSTLYAIAKLLNGIGSHYLNDGIDWIFIIIKNNKKLQEDVLILNTTYYIEKVIRTFISKNREKIRKTVELKNKVILILDFLVMKNSVTGYMLRENIL